MADRIGQKLGNYRLLRLLGQGGFAEVYLGEHVHLKTQAAIKVLHTQLTDQDYGQFLTEARMAASLVHSHIVRVLEFGVEEGTTPFLVMDYASNGTLRQRHPKGSRVPLKTVVSYVKQIAEALQYAHDEKLIHRDVKPENMLIGRRGEIILSDFGVAAISHGTFSMTVQAFVGTAPYMAPEQIQAHARVASDQYALGIVVYEWLSGEHPFDGSFTEIIAKHLMVPPPSLCQRVSTISVKVEKVISIALAKDPKQRFPSVSAFAIALEQASAASASPPIPLDSPISPLSNVQGKPFVSPISPREQSLQMTPLIGSVQDASEFTGPEPVLVRVPKVSKALSESVRKKYGQLQDSDFEIGKYTVTNIEYKRFVEATGHQIPECWNAGTFPPEKAIHPVVGITQRDAEKYCVWLSKQTGNKYRLPREGEWEWAATGPKEWKYPWGNQPDERRCNTRESGRGKTTPVNRYVAGKSFFGASDMCGNVWEMTIDESVAKISSHILSISFLLVLGVIVWNTGVIESIYTSDFVRNMLILLLASMFFGLGEVILVITVITLIIVLWLLFCFYRIIVILLREMAFLLLEYLRRIYVLRGGAWNASIGVSTCYSRRYEIDKRATGFRMVREIKQENIKKNFLSFLYQKILMVFD